MVDQTQAAFGATPNMFKTVAHSSAPPLEVSEWLNAPGGLSLSALRGRVVMLHAFQMLCPGCVSHGLPQASKVREMFAEVDVAVIG